MSDVVDSPAEERPAPAPTPGLSPVDRLRLKALRAQALVIAFLIFVFDQEKFTVPLGLRALSTLDRTNFPLLLAGSVAATLPVILSFLYVQRYFLQEFRGAGYLGR